MQALKEQKEVEMFYDEYECNFGDGFYPLLEQNPALKSIHIQFIKNDVWKQKTCGPIFGLDGSTGEDLLQLLNETESIKLTKIVNVYGKQIYPK
jgi:hypothetical protein